MVSPSPSVLTNVIEDKSEYERGEIPVIFIVGLAPILSEKVAVNVTVLELLTIPSLKEVVSSSGFNRSKIGATVSTLNVKLSVPA